MMASQPVLGAAFALLSTLMSGNAAGPDQWVPVRWHGGPLDVHRTISETNQAAFVRDWYNLRTLKLLDGTPLNCILVTWSAGSPPELEAEQQTQLASYARAAHERSIAVIGVIYPGSDLQRAALAAMSAGLDGIALEGFEDATAAAGPIRRTLGDFPVIPFGFREQLFKDGASPVSAVADSVAPGIHPISDAATATPTTEPWIDFNSWLARLVRDHSRGRPVWLGHRIETQNSAGYVRAIADAAVAGARWVVAPEYRLREGLWCGDPKALAAWREIATELRFYEEHAAWRHFAPASVVGIFRSDADPDPDLTAETVKLVARRRIPYCILERSKLDEAAVSGLRVLLATDVAEPGQHDKDILTAFAKSGGTVVTLACKESGCPGQFGYEVIRSGAGTVVAYPERPDPEALSKNTLELVGTGKLPVRLFNVPSVLPHITVAPGGKSMLIQLVNYADLPAERITLRVAGAFRTARLFTPGRASAALPMQISGDNVEVLIPTLAGSSAVLFEK